MVNYDEAQVGSVRFLKRPWFWAAVAGIGSVISAVAAIAAIGVTMADSDNQTRRRLQDDLYVLAQLQRLSSESISSNTSGCGGDGCLDQPCGMESCLGHLALAKAYRDQYQLVTTEAVELAAMIPGKTSASERLQISEALYRSGDVQSAKEHVISTMARSTDFAIKFRGNLLLAQIHFFERNLESGNAFIKAAIEVVENSKGHTSIERAVFIAEARLVCASMHSALGEVREARGCLEHAYTELRDMPKTSFVQELENAIVAELTIIIRKEGQTKSPTFDELESKLRKSIAEEVEDTNESDSA